VTAKIKHRRLVASGIVLGAVIVFAGLLALRPQPERRKPQTPAPLVTIHEVTAEQPPITVEGWGTVEAKRAINLVPQVSGRVTSVSERMQAGAFFDAGEVLVRVDETDYRLAVEQSRSQVAQAEYSLATVQEEAHVARAEWERLQRDGDAGGELTDAEPSALVFREPQLRQARAALDAARAALELAELNLARCTLTAPFAGRVLEEAVDLGQYVRTGEVLGRIYDTEVAEITVNLADRDLAWIAVPREQDGAGGTTAIVRGEFGGRTHDWQGKAVRIGGAIDEVSRTVPVVVEVGDPYATDDGRPPLLKGMFVQILFRAEPPAGSVTIPRRGLRPRDEVWVLDDEDNLRIRQVEVARASIETAVITGGLQPGDRLITSNLQYVVDGMAVRINGASQGGPPAEGPGGVETVQGGAQR
jgi:RND family efflux transporter MFP subunit